MVVVAEAGAEAVAAEMEVQNQDRVGLGWRPELAAGIFAHLEHVDVVEVIADDWFQVPRYKAMALRTLATQVSVQLHGTSVGLASAAGVEEERLAKMARLVEIVQPEAWSEHLAFVRAGGTEIGHLAAVPRTMTTVDHVATNVDRARKIVGLAPMVENIATLIDPPASRMNEVDWLRAVVAAADAPLLLDLHNLYANSVNFGGNSTTAPFEALRRLRLERVTTVHIAGGRWIPAGREQRLLDDHLHAVPDIVYEMLEDLAALAPQPLTVILERDGAFPGMQALLFELELARSALRRGRTRSKQPEIVSEEPFLKTRDVADRDESAANIETLLACIYADEKIRAQFLSSPSEFARHHGLSNAIAAQLTEIDQVGLEMAAASFHRKRRLKNAAENMPARIRHITATLRRTFAQFTGH